jgi:hypothetical protein
VSFWYCPFEIYAAKQAHVSHIHGTGFFLSDTMSLLDYLTLSAIFHGAKYEVLWEQIPCWPIFSYGPHAAACLSTFGPSNMERRYKVAIGKNLMAICSFCCSGTMHRTL